MSLNVVGTGESYDATSAAQHPAVPRQTRLPAWQPLTLTFPVSLETRGRPRSSCQRGVQLGERLEPALLAGGHQMLREPLANLESRPSVGLVVELD